MKLYLTIVALAALAAGARAADAPPAAVTVALYNFTGEAEAAKLKLGDKVTALVTADLATETNLIMLERSELAKALGEQAFGDSGLVSSDTAAKIGRITGAKILVCGQVFLTRKNHMVVVASIIGTETGRLFAVKTEGPKENLMEMTADLSRQIAQKITDQAGNLITKDQSHDEVLDRIVKNVTGTNRPTISFNIHFSQGPTHGSTTANTEMGIILQKAGFTVVDGNSDRKPDVIITGVVDYSYGPRRGSLFSCRATVEAKVQERLSGKIIAFDRQLADAVDVGRNSANRSAQVNAIDGLAERIVPLLAK